MWVGMTKPNPDLEEQNVAHWHENEGAASKAYKEPTTLYKAAKCTQSQKLG